MTQRPFIFAVDTLIHILVFLRLFDPNSDFSLSTSLLDLLLSSLIRFTNFKRVWLVALTAYYTLIKLSTRYLLFEPVGDQVFYVPLFLGSLTLSLLSAKASLALTSAAPTEPTPIDLHANVKQMIKLIIPP